MRVDTSDFESSLSHGKKPKGYGLWVFELYGRNSEPLEFQFHGNYGDAKKAALKNAKLHGCDYIVVMP